MRFAPLLLFVLASASAVTADACSSTSDDDVSQDFDASVHCMCLPDGGVIGSCAGKCPRPPLDAAPFVPACFDGSRAGTLVGRFTGPALHQGKCSSDEIATYLAECLGSGDGGADASVDGGVDAGACQSFVRTSALCATCLVGPSDPDAGPPGPTPVILPTGGAPTLDIAGCLAAISGADAACQSSFEESQFCAVSACVECMDDPSDTACINFVLDDATTLCPSHVSVDPACSTQVNGVSDAHAQRDCGISSANDFASNFIGIANAMCGGVADGGDSDAGD